MAVITVTSTADNGAGSLRAAIAAARSGDIIQFGAGLANKTILLTSGQIEISPGKNITIDGMGAANLTISGNNASRIFWVNSNQDSVTNVAIKNLTLTNGRTTEEGGAILGEHKANITVENVKFQANTADKGGGAIYSKWENNLTVINSQFNGNVATKGNAELGAGAIAFISPGQFLVRNSTFTNNQGINGGAINSLNGKLTIEGSKFINNSTLAAVLDTGKPNPDLRGYGGALYTDRASSVNEPAGTIRIVNSQFEGNKSKHGGGGAYLYTGTQDNVAIEGTSFKDNQTDKGVNGDGANGGGLYVISSDGQNKGLVLNRTSFVNNTASNQGGGLWMYGAPTTITNSTFSGNKAIFSTVPGQNDFNRNGGAIAFYEAPATITNTTVANNLAGWVAGGILADEKLAVTVKNTIFFNNEAFNGGNPWNIQKHTNRLMSNGGGNIQNTPENDGGLAVANISVADPRLGPLQDNGGNLLTHALLAGSPAINAGVTSGAPTVDGRGLNRDSQPDSGAFEFGASGGSNPGNPTNPGTPGNITGTAGNDTLTGTTGKDTILAGAGNDFLTGGLGADTLTTGAGADRVLYRGNNQLTAFAGSRVNSLDRVTDFNVVQGDRIQLDYDNNLTTSQRPQGLFNAGAVQGNNLTAAVKAAYADKNQKVAKAQVLKTNEAVLLQWQNRTYLSVNDTVRAFDPARDFVVNVTGLTIPTAHTTAGSLPVNSYFA